MMTGGVGDTNLTAVLLDVRAVTVREEEPEEPPETTNAKMTLPTGPPPEGRFDPRRYSSVSGARASPDDHS
jgi:hypothetical protein